MKKLPTHLKFAFQFSELLEEAKQQLCSLQYKSKKDALVEVIY
jgi:hypothetical protein